MKLKTFLLWVTMLPLFSVVQAQSTSGTDFWMAFIQNADLDLDKPYYLSILLTSTEATEVSVSSPLGFSQAFTLDRNTSKRIDIPFDDFNVTEYGKAVNKTLHITSTNPISVYAENYQARSNDATLVLPISACGSYYIIQHNVGRSESRSYVFMPATFSIIAFDDDTEVEIIPTLSTSTGQEKGEPFTITLKEGEVFQLASQKTDQGSGLSGSQIRVLNGKKVAVYAGNRCTNVPDACTAGDSDMLFEVQYPVSSWGKKFIVQPFVNDINDMIKCTACKDGTKIYKDGELLTTINAFESYEFFIKESDGPFMIEASEPIALYQYMTSSNYNVSTERPIGGPSFQYVVPLEQSIERVTFSTLDNKEVKTHYVNIVIKKEDISTVTLNGQTNFATFTPYDDVYAMASVQLEEGQYTLEAKSGFIANVYGMGQCVSYSYVAGSKIEDINATEGSYLVTYDGNEATSGSMPNHLFNIGTDETTLLDANEFQRSYTVSFDTKGGEEIADEQVNYTFENWIHEQSTGYSFFYKDKEPTVNIVRETGAVVALKAQWEPDSLKLPLPVRDRYDFVGWTTQKNGRKAEYLAGDQYIPKADVVLYAIWEFHVEDYMICDNGTILFKEDFGGNYVGDPDLGPGLPEGTISLHFSNHVWDLLKNGYDIRKEAIRRRETNPRNHVYSGWYADFGDHTYEEDLTRGYFMIIDLDYLEATFYKVQVDELCENTLLYFSFWGHPINASADAPVTLTLEDMSGNVLNEEVFTIDHTHNGWQHFGMPFIMPAGETSVVYKVFSGAGGNGGDFGLDDIEIRLCTPPINVNVPDDSLCVKSGYTLRADLDSAATSLIEPITYTWYKNKEKNYNNTGWEKVHVGKELVLSNITKDNEGYYKVFASSAGETSDYNMCSSFSDIVPVMVKTCNISERIYQTICHGSSYTLGGNSFNQTGVYKVKMPTSENPDNEVVLDLTVLDEKKTVLSETICSGSSYKFGNKILKDNGTYTEKFSSASGCDSLVILTLDVLPSTSSTITGEVVQGSDYDENGFDLPEQTHTGIFNHQLKLTNVYGCDSIVNLKLRVVAPPVVPDYMEIPTAFTPHFGDGLNDWFMPGYEVYIYDRYGNLICHSTNGWDGTYRGEVATAGVYVYTLFMKDGKKRTGTIEIVKSK